MDEIMTAARNAAADSFIQKMDGGQRGAAENSESDCPAMIRGACAAF